MMYISTEYIIHQHIIKTRRNNYVWKYVELSTTHGGIITQYGLLNSWEMEQGSLFSCLV